MSDELLEDFDDSLPHVTFYTEGEGRWLKRVWAVRCPETILLRDRCQGVAGHLGDHWCFQPDGSYHYKPHETDPKRKEVGCGAGNNTLKLKEVYGKPFACDLLDLSRPMLERAKERVLQAGIETVELWQDDFRDAELPRESYDVILAAAVLHHLRDDEDWQAAFEKLLSLLKPGGSVWITDLVVQETVPIHELMWSRYGDYLEGLGGSAYRQKVFDYIAREDSPRSVTYQLELLRRVGFAYVELLHKNSCFAAFSAWKE